MRFLILFSLLSLKAFCSPSSKARFIQNIGQWDDQIKFKVELPNGVMKITNHSFIYSFRTSNQNHPFTELKSASSNQNSFATIEAVFLGANKSLTVKGLSKSESVTNFFIGNDPSKWQANVPSYEEIIINDIYDGIDLRLFSYGNSLKYEYILKPFSDAKQIRIEYKGVKNTSIIDGVFNANAPNFTLKELKPYSFQKTDNSEIETKSAYRLSDNVLTFDFPDGYNHTLPLVIDPVLIFSSYSGLNSDNWGHTATYSFDGALFSGGTSNSTITKEGDENTSAWDLCILKFSADGTKLLYTTYLGGKESTDVPHSMIENSKGELVIFGTTGSSDFPTTINAFDKTFNGGKRVTGVNGMDYNLGSDIFVLKLDKNGALMNSTFMGGNDNDGLNITRNNLVIRNYGDEYRGEVVLDAKDQVFVASISNSINFPVQNAEQINKSSNFDAVVFSLSDDLSKLRWSTYLGGNGFDAAYSIKVSSKNEIFVGGVTNSDNFKTLSSNNQALKGSEDGFLTKYSADFKLNKSVLIGSQGADIVQLIDLDKDENPHLFGLTSGDFLVSAGVYSNPKSGQFVQSLSNNLETVNFSTVIGTGQGVPDIIPTAFSVSECGNIYLAGWGGDINANITSMFGNKSTVKGMPVTQDAYKATTEGNNFYLAMLEKNAKSLLYATFFGSSGKVEGDHLDGGTCRFDKKGFIYHAACSCNTSGAPSNFSTSPNAYARTNPSLNCNNAAFKFSVDSLRVSFDTFQGTVKNVVQGCAPLSLRFVNTSIGGKVYEWDIAGLAKSQSSTETAYTFDKGGEYKIVLKGTNLLSCNREGIDTRTIKVIPTEFKIIPDQKICTGGSVQLTAGGGTKYKWSPSDGLSRTDVANPIANPANSTKYTLEIFNEIGCSNTLAVNVEVDKTFAPDFSIEKNYECGKKIELSVVNKANGFDKSWLITGAGDTLKNYTGAIFSYQKPGNYQVTVKNFKGNCELSATKNVQVENQFEVTNVITPNNDGKNDFFEIGNVAGVSLEVYDRWGKQIYQSNDYKNDWGGSKTNGIYYYTIIMPKGNKCKGWIEVIN